MTFLRAYNSYAERLTDSPPLFHTWVGIGLLAAALGNGAWCWSWGKRLCANVWILLLADSGILRKTTALNIGQQVLIEAIPDAVWPSEWSYEALLAQMADRPAGSILISEYKVFNAALSKDYAGGSRALLVDTYDNPPVRTRRTLKGGTVEIRHPAPTFIACTNRTWFESSLTSDDIGGGQFNRMMVITATKSGKWKGIGESRSDADHLLRENLSEHLVRVRSVMEGEVNLSLIREPFNAWLEAYEATWRGPQCTPELAGTIARTGANCLKLAMIFQADLDPSLTLSMEAFEKARKLVEHTNQGSAALLAEGLGLTREGRERRRVAEAIRAAYPSALPHSLILKNLHLSSRDLEKHIVTLIEAGDIRTASEPQGKQGGRPAKGYRWLNGATP
jgi:hypothetical protein